MLGWEVEPFVQQVRAVE